MITIQQDTLKAALNAVTRASQKSGLPAFALVRLDAKTDGSLNLSCFNGETAARAITYVACDDDLSVCVDAQTLKEVVETLVNEIHLSIEQNSLLIQNGKNRTTMRLVEETVPVIGEESVQNLTVLSGSAFRSLARVLPFAASDSARPVLQVLHLTLEKDRIIAKAADGYSAGYVHESIQETAEQTSISLPLSFARLLSSLVEEHDKVRIGKSGSPVHFFGDLPDNDLQARVGRLLGIDLQGLDDCHTRGYNNRKLAREYGQIFGFNPVEHVGQSSDIDTALERQRNHGVAFFGQDFHRKSFVIGLNKTNDSSPGRAYCFVIK